METILAIAFGREVNVQQGEADKLTEAANFLVSQETALPIPLMSFLLGESGVYLLQVLLFVAT